MTSPAPDTASPSRGGALFALGFRPLYLLGALGAITGVGLWVLALRGMFPLPPDAGGMAWHAHEMVFGFAAAVIAGFLFTAGRNWTGLPTPTGALLAGLCALWLAGRLGLLLLPRGPGAVVDLAFLPAVAVALWIPLQRARNRNRFMVGLLLLLAGANAVFHLGIAGLVPLPPLDALRFALYVIVLLITIMGGRVIPSFTANAIRGARTRPRRPLDLAAIAVLALALALAIAWPTSPVTAVACLAAASLHAWRLATWDPLCTRGTPILWILHVSYAWIQVGLLLHAATAAGFGPLTVHADHALSVGAVGGMVLGMITRTALGHSGRPLRVGRWEVAAYVLVHAAALVRVFLPLVGADAHRVAVALAGALWTAAFVVYLAMYLPILTRARAGGKPG